MMMMMVMIKVEIKKSDLIKRAQTLRGGVRDKPRVNDEEASHQVQPHEHEDRQQAFHRRIRQDVKVAGRRMNSAHH